MRALLCVLLIGGCGPKVAPTGSAFDEDLQSRNAETAAAPPEGSDKPRPEAPKGKGLRTGTIERAKLIAVLDGGPGAFLRQLEVTAHMDGNRFVGWQLVQLLDKHGPLVDVDVAPGDVLLAVNGKPLSRPDQLQWVWDSLRTANELRAQLWRGDARLELDFAIEPAIDQATVTQKPAPAATQPVATKPTPAQPATPAKSTEPVTKAK